MLNWLLKKKTMLKCVSFDDLNLGEEFINTYSHNKTVCIKTGKSSYQEKPTDNYSSLKIRLVRENFKVNRV